MHSENHIVSRGIKAIGLIYHLTGRVPTLIKQSHLEEREGSFSAMPNHETVSDMFLPNQLGLLTGLPFSSPFAVNVPTHAGTSATMPFLPYNEPSFLLS